VISRSGVKPSLQGIAGAAYVRQMAGLDQKRRILLNFDASAHNNLVIQIAVKRNLFIVNR
jgi:hypothetical protein